MSALASWERLLADDSCPGCGEVSCICPTLDLDLDAAADVAWSDRSEA